MDTNILDFGAVPGKTELCTKAIQSAIELCAATGGGRVTIPEGEFLSGTIWLKSHVELHLKQGAWLIASDNQEDYNPEDAYVQNFGSASEEWKGQHFILAVEQEDVAITGSGILDGRGDAFFGDERKYGTTSWVQGYVTAKDKVKLRPGQLICFIECTNVLVKNITLQNTPCWGLFLHGCEDVQVYGIQVFNPLYFVNTDGIDIDACKQVVISDCVIDTGDDAIAIRCDTEHLKDKNKICENITIRNCSLGSSSCGVRVGVGKGSIKHVFITNIKVQRAGKMFAFMTSFDGNGGVEITDFSVMNVLAKNINHAFDITDVKGVGIHNVLFSDMRIETNYNNNINTANKGSISDIMFRNIELEVKSVPVWKEPCALVQCNGVANLIFEQVNIQGEFEIINGWYQDFRFVECSEVELRNCKYRK